MFSLINLSLDPLLPFLSVWPSLPSLLLWLIVVAFSSSYAGHLASTTTLLVSSITFIFTYDFGLSLLYLRSGLLMGLSPLPFRAAFLPLPLLLFACHFYLPSVRCCIFY